MASLDDLRDELDIQKEINSILNSRSGINEDIYDYTLNTLDVLKQSVKQASLGWKTQSEYLKIMRSIGEISSRNFTISLKELGTQKSLKKIKSDIDLLDKQRLNLEKRLTGLSSDSKYDILRGDIEDQIQGIQDLKFEMMAVRNISNNLISDKTVKRFSFMTDLIKAIPGLRKFSSPFEDAQGKAMESVKLRAKAEQELGKKLNWGNLKFGDKKELLGKGFSKEDIAKLAKSPFKSGMSALTKGFKGLVGKAGWIGLAVIAVQKLWGTLMDVNKQTVELSRNMNMTAEEASEYREYMTDIQEASADIFITTKNLLKSIGIINSQMGFITDFAAEDLATFTRINEKLKLTAEASSNLLAISSLTGASFQENYLSALNTSYAMQRQAGVGFNLKEILEETGKITGQVRANLGNNPAALAAAVTQAKLLGTSLDKVVSAGKSMLDFESSITSELEAELLIGKNINLEKARQYALQGDQVNLAKELKKQAGDYSTFQKMNVIQQESISKALGMSADEMSNLLLKQEIQGKNAKQLRAMGREELAQAIERQTFQEKYNQAIEKLKGYLIDLVAKIEPFLNWLLDADDTMAPKFGEMSTKFGSSVSVYDDAVIPNTHGDTVISTPKGTIALNNKDQVVVAGTNLNKNQKTTQQQVVDMRETNALLREILHKGAKVQMDSTDIGTAISMNSFKIQ